MDVRETTTMSRYEELAETLRKKIISGVYPRGSKIPSEAQLMADTSLSRSTVRRALDVLVEENLLTKERGKGTFVPDTPAIDAERTRFTSFTTEMARRGAAVSTSVVDIIRTSAPTAVADFLGTGDAMVPTVVRMRYLDGKPLCLETIHLDPACGDLEDADWTGSLHMLLRERCQRVPGGGHKTFEVCFATQREAFLLGVERGTALMLVTDFALDLAGAPLYASKRVMRTDQVKYTEAIG